MEKAFEQINNNVNKEKEAREAEVLGNKFNSEDSQEFKRYLRQKIKENPSQRFSIVADWVSLQKTRSAKALLDQYATRLNIDSITIRATREQYEEDVNAFQSGVIWEEVEE
ncbi:MAG: hypothetical protein CR972_03195 [Candidatus Moraniibacteriota bacterium]|nr:MAG: hypothetical protein CR972_03195 [Candidatus Moranbacteria bacterium]